MQLFHVASKNCTHRDRGLLDIGVASSRGMAVISVAGELEVSNHQRLTRCLSEITDAGFTEIILDVERLTYMDSAGLSVLVASHKRMETTGGSFSILAPTHIVKRLFDVTAQMPYRMIDAVAV